LPGYASSNRWEAVLTIDANGVLSDPLTGIPTLKDGNYTIEALAPVLPTTSNPLGQSGLRDVAGNALGRTGYTPDGVSQIRQFSETTSQGEISGVVWNDLNYNELHDWSDPGLANWTVYLDLPDATHPHGNGVLDIGEISTTTLVDGSYNFTNVAAGTYFVREVLPSNWQTITPAVGYYTEVIPDSTT
jgi:hypothetical protein